MNLENIKAACEVRSAMCIDKNNDILLEKASKGDKSAFAQLVMVWRQRVIFLIEAKYKEFLRPDLIDDILNQGVIVSIEQHAKDVKVTGKVKKDWQDNMNRDMNFAIEDILEPKISNKKFTNYNRVERVTFLNKINRLLKQAEQEIIDRVRVYLKAGENELRINHTSAIRNDVEVTVYYFLEANDHHVHSHWDYFRLDEITTIEKKFDIALFNEIERLSPGNIWPVLDDPFCYLMHNFIYHSRLYEKVFELNRIEICIGYPEYKIIGIKRNGDSVWFNG